MINELILFDGTITANGDTKTAFQEISEFQEANFFLNCTAASGTSPTLDVDVLTYSEKTGEWYVIGSFKQISGVDKDIQTLLGGLGGRNALLFTVGGTDPSFTVKISGQYKTL
jgi:hypothetical protein